MVQEFNVLRCFSCRTFQVHQVKKANKWLCKVCGEKQSTKKIYGQGRAPDCRKHVQKLNSLQGQMEQLKGEKAAVDDGDDDNGAECWVGKQNEGCSEAPCGSAANNKWEKYVDDNSEDVCDTITTEDLWHGVPVTTDHHTIFQETNKTKHSKRKRQHDNRDETMACISYKRQSFTHPANPTARSRNNANSGFAFSDGKVDTNVDASKLSSLGHFKDRSNQKQSKCPETNLAADEGDFLFTRKRMDKKMGAPNSKWVGFQADTSLPFADNSMRSRNVSVDKPMNKNRSGTNSKSTPVLKNDVLQNKNVSGTWKRVSEKATVKKAGSRWDKFQTGHTSRHHDSDEDNDDDVLRFTSKENMMNGKEWSTNKIGFKWEKFQSHQTPDDDDDNCTQNSGINGDDNDGDDDSLRNISNNDYGDSVGSFADYGYNKTQMFTGYQAYGNAKANAQSKWEKFQTVHSNNNTFQLNENQIEEYTDGNNTIKWVPNYQSNSKYNFVQDYNQNKDNLCQTRNLTGIPASMKREEITNNNEKSRMNSNVFQIDEELEGEWWNI